MTAAKDHTGVRYGKIVGICPTDIRKNKQIVWKWVCDCGNIFESTPGNYAHRNYSSGCYACAKASTATVTGDRSRTHGMRNSKEYKSWVKIKERCLCPTCKDYSSYGGSGITICDEWANSFELFISHIGLHPNQDNRWTVDRIDNNCGYIPGNVRWATDAQQARNKGKMSNNTSGVTGVKIDEKSPGRFYAVAIWTTLGGKQTQKSFSYKKYGEELAFLAACEARDQAIRLLNLQGAQYSENHGK